MVKQVTKRRDDINGTMFTEGDIAIAIQWDDRLDDESDRLSFEKWVDTEGDAFGQDIINSTELRASSSTPFENGLHYLRWCVSKLFSQHSSRQQCRDVQAAKRPCRRWLRQCQSQTMQCGTCLP